jgi:hypothetical protein
MLVECNAPFGGRKMQQRTTTTQFHVTIEYRTKHRLAIWYGMVTAENMERASEIGEKLLRRRSRALLRVDRVTVR